MNRRLNLKLIAAIASFAVLLSVGLYFLHAMQVRRNAGTLLSLAEHARDAGDADEAVNFYQQYVQLRPDDLANYAEFAQMRAEQAEALAKEGDDQEAIKRSLHLANSALETALRKMPERDDLRRRVAEFAMRFGRYRDAEEHLAQLVKRHPDDGELQVMYGRCLVVAARYHRAATLFYRLVGYDESTGGFDLEKAVAPENIDAYVLGGELARVYLEREEIADQLMAQLIAINAGEYRAYLERARFLQRRGDLDGAREDIRQALVLAPDEVEVILTSAELALDRQEFAEAREQLQRGVENDPEEERFYRVLAMVELAQHNATEAALGHIQQGLQAVPQSQLLLPFRADLELQSGDLAAARATVAAMAAAEMDLRLTEYLQARILVAEHQWVKAARELERLRPLMARQAELVTQIDLYLGFCYERLGQPDRALAAYRRALLADARLDLARRGVERMLAATGQAKTRRQVDLPREIQRIFAAPRAQRNWKPLEPWLREAARERGLDDTMRAILRAEVYAAAGELDRAREAMEQARAKQPGEFRLHLAAAQLAARDPDGGAGPALGILAEAGRHLGDTVELRLAKAMLLIQGLGDESRQQLIALEDNVDAFSATDRRRLWAGLGAMYLSAQLHDDVRRAWRRAAAADPNDLDIRFRLFQLARDRNDVSAMEQAADEIKRLVDSESDPVWTFCQAALLTEQADKGEPGRVDLEAAQELVDAALTKRPEWHELHQLQAAIDIRQGDLDEAIDHLQRSFELGPATPYAVSQLVKLLSMRGRYAEAKRAIEMLDRRLQNTLLPELQAEIQLRTGDAVRAVQLASDAVRLDPQNHIKQLWLGQVLLRAGDRTNALAALRKSVELKPDAAVSRLALVYFLHEAGQTEQARAEIAAAMKALPVDSRVLFAAQAAEVLGDAEVAEAKYRAALDAAPNDPDRLQAAARFYLSGVYSAADGRQQAAPLLEKLLSKAGQPDAAGDHIEWARRVKAQLLAASGGYSALREALDLVEANAIDGRLRKEDLLLQARLLAQRPEAISRRRAIRLLEQAKQEYGLNVRDAMLLAQLHFRAENWPRCEEEMLELVSQYGDNAAVLATWCKMLLEENRTGQAQVWVDRLNEIAPDDESTRQMTVRLLAQRGRKDEAAALAIGELSSPLTKEQLPEAARALVLLEQLELYEAAEALYRRYVAAEPGGALARARFLGQHRSAREAFEILTAAEKTHSPGAIIQAGLLTVRARRSEVGDRYDAQLENWLTKARRAEPQSAAVLLQLASLRDLQGRHDEEERIYRTLLAQPTFQGGPRAGVLNNLAFNLAMRGAKLADARKAIDEAIRIQGPTGALLDTRAMARLAAGDVERAISDLNLAIADAPNATRYFHLALAQLAKGDKQAAHSALAQAENRGLDADEISALERPQYNRLRSELGLDSGSRTTRRAEHRAA
jgi:tetratricopeptide (TPR) repeat protein